MTVIGIVLFFLLGIAVGSFLNVVADRLPAGKSIISPPSHCPKCQRRIASSDLIPVFSYLWLKGRCRYCGTTIPVRSLIVELATGILFVFLYWYYGIGWELAIVIIYCCLFIILIITDLERSILPDKLVYPGMVLALIFAGLGSLLGFEPSFVANAVPRIFKLWIVDAAIGGSTGFVILFVIALISRGGMGGGDVKLVGFIGLAAGFPLVFVTIFMAVMSGGLIAMILLLLKIKRRKEAIPFGPFLCLAAMATLLWGNDLLQWYLKASIFTMT
jgi:leader peptidase (prepilin peptidase)/N-methyltransferase